MQITPKSRSRCIRSRIANNPPIRNPAASAPRTKPHAVRPTVSSATTGPSTVTPPTNAMLMTPNAATTTQSQARVTNACHPSIRSRSTLLCSRFGCSAALIRTKPKNRAATAKLAASMAIPQADPSPATRIPAAATPSRLAALAPMRANAFAGTSWSAGTVCGTSATDAGNANALSVPLTADSTASKATESVRANTSTATTPCVAALARLDPTRMTLRGTRSATTPPSSKKITFASERAPTTMPRLVAEPVRSSTAKASATGAIALPSRLTVLPITR